MPEVTRRNPQCDAESRDAMTSMDPRELARPADPAGARAMPTQPRSPRVEETLHRYPAAGLRRRGAAAEGPAGRCRRRQGVPAAGRRLRRELRRVPPEQHPRHLQGAAADGGGADLRRRLPGRQARPAGRPVRQAALVGHRDAERRHAALLSRRHHQRPRFRRRRRASPTRSAWCRPTASRPRP